MSKIIGLKDLRENMNGYISQIGKGRSFVVVRKSKPVFRLAPVDEWGDEGVWKTVVDFSAMKNGGMPMKDFLRLLKKNE